ncbi:lipopolysaccharide biosynthesis protein [Chryseobacterium sp. A321]
MSLRKQTFSGLIWTVLDTFAIKGLSFVATIILARILGPAEFGLIGMITVFIALGTSLVDSGLSSSLIRTQKANDKDYSTVFYLNIATSIFVYFILFYTAPYIAKFYDQNILTSIIRLYCLSFIISAFSAVQIAILTRDMNFKKLMKINVPGTILGVGVGLTLGYFGYGVWSIVWMYLTTQVIQSMILWLSSEWKPTLTFDWIRMKYHYGFGYKLMLSGVLNTSFSNLYNIVIGKFFPVQVLGYYERAYSFNQYPVTTLIGVINKVTYPLLSSIQTEENRIEKVYQQLIKFSFFVTAPLMIGLSAVAEPLFLLVLGEQWIPAVPFFQILCLSSILLPIHSLNLNILKVYGRSDLFLKLEILKKIIITVSIIIAFQFGIYGLLWSSVITSVIALIINTHYSAPFIKYSTKKQLLDLIPVLIICGVMFCIMSGAMSLINDFNSIFKTLLTGILGGLVYFGLSYSTKNESLIYLLTLLKDKKNKI